MDEDEACLDCTVMVRSRHNLPPLPEELVRSTVTLSHRPTNSGRDNARMGLRAASGAVMTMLEDEYCQFAHEVVTAALHCALMVLALKLITLPTSSED
jgi:hypothetical protein